MRTKKEVTIQDAANMPAFRSENRGFIGFGFAVLYCGVAMKGNALVRGSHASDGK